MSDLTAEDIRQLLDYDPATGIFIWRERVGDDQYTVAFNTRFLGKTAGTKDHLGYFRILVFGKLYLAHRLVWLWMTGLWPIKHLDHIDRNPSNNAFSNLRECTHAQNHWNITKSKTNRCGFKGVTFQKSRGKFRSEIKFNRRRVVLGRFDTAEEAHAAYIVAAQKYHGEFARTE